MSCINRRRISLLAGRILLVVGAGALTLASMVFSARRADHQLRDDLLRETRIAAMAINPHRVQMLSGTTNDLTTRHYRWVKNQLVAIRSADPDIRFLYLIERQNDGTVVFLVESEPETSQDHSPPGLVYGEMEASLLHVFTTGQGEVQGPFQDRWGTWISAFVPFAPQTIGGRSVLLGADVDARKWKRAIALHAAFPVVLATIAILLAVGLVLLQRSRKKLGERQRELKESEARFIQLADQSRTLAWEVNAQGLYTHISPAAELVLGYRPDEIIGRMHFYDLIPAERRAEIKRTIFDAMERKESFVNFENPILAKDGRALWALTNAVPLLNGDKTLLGYRGSDIDITARQQTEEQIRTLLAESNQSRQALLGILEDQLHAEADRKRLATAIEQAAEIVVVTDAQGIIQYVNPAFVAVTGYSREEVVGQNPRILSSGHQSADFYRKLWDTISKGKTWRGRFINKRKNGSLYDEDALISPVLDDAGRIINYVGVKHDVSENLRLSEQLQQSQKMDSIGRLAGGIAHDFNNMLGVILGHSEVAMEHIDKDHPLYVELLEIRKAAERSAALTRQLLAFARKQTVTPKVLDLNETVEGMLKMLRRLIGENITLAWQPKVNLWPIRMDPSQIDQILANLCVNARDAISGVGDISIETDNVVFDPAAEEDSPEVAPGDYVRIDIRDTGRGMDPETVSHIFEPFFSTKDGSLGNGLGLATVYGIVKQNNGFIQVESEPNRGTSFHVFLPRHLGAIEPLPKRGATTPVPRGTETILLVEDEPAILKITAQMIESLGYTVQKADTPAEALRVAQEQGNEIHLLMTDVVMPEMNGRDLAKKILSIRPDLKCLFMSGYTADVIARNGVLDKGVHFIEKPFLKQTLAAQLREALESDSA